MIIEDDRDISQVIGDYLSETYDVVRAANGVEALELIKGLGELPCIVFLDLMMPVMNGWEFLHHVQRHGLLPGVRIVAVTAAAKASLPESISFIAKPINLSDLDQSCEGVCESKKKA